MQRGTIHCRRDPDDLAEWQFALRKAVAYANEEQKHEFKGETNVKAEALHWLEVKAQGLLGSCHGTEESGALALQEVLNKDKKSKGNAEELGDENKALGAQSKTKDEQVVEADALSDIGNRKTEAHTRVSRMLKLAKSVQKTLGSKSEALDKCVDLLTKLDKKGKKISLEEAKSCLFDAALEIKKAKANQ